MPVLTTNTLYMSIMLAPMNTSEFNDIFKFCEINFSYNNSKYKLSCTVSKVLIYNKSYSSWQIFAQPIEMMFNTDRNVYVGPHNIFIPCEIIDHLLIENNVKAPIPCSN